MIVIFWVFFIFALFSLLPTIDGRIGLGAILVDIACLGIKLFGTHFQ